MRWTDETIEVAQRLTETDEYAKFKWTGDDAADRERAKPLLAKLLDVAWAAQAKSDPWAKFLAGKWQEDPTHFMEEHCERPPYLVSRYRDGDRSPWTTACDVPPWKSEYVRDADMEYWSVALPEETPG